MTQTLRLGITCAGLIEWGGGIDLLRLLLSALQEVRDQCRDQHIELTLFMPALAARPGVTVRLRQALLLPGHSSVAARLKGAYWEMRSPDRYRRDREMLLASLREAGGRFTVRDHRGKSELAELALRCRIDVMAPSIVDLGAEFSVPWVGYIPDVQHRHLGHLFGSAELQERDAIFTSILRNADSVVATSESVKADLRSFFSVPRPIVALPFAPPLPMTRTLDSSAAAAKYGIGGRFFIVCNQFWKHKSHITAFEALAKVHSQSEMKDVELVCTGNTDDYRDPSYFGSLMDRCEELGIGSKVHVLGRIPKDDQLALMCGAIALVQPTLFEGTQGGLAVYEAVSLGVRCLVSDISVNVEAHDELITFFRAGDAADLARRMLDSLLTAPPRPTLEARTAVGKTRLKSLGLAFLEGCRAARAGRRLLGAIEIEGSSTAPLATMETE